MNFHWPESSIEQLKTMYAEGASMREIAREIGATRNAVIGKVHRLGLVRVKVKQAAQSRVGDGGLVTKVRSRMQRNRQLQVTVRRQVVGTDALNQILKAEPLPPPATDDLTRTAHSVTLLGLTNDTCRWPCGEPSSADFFYCGRPEADLDAGRPYCATHQWRARARL